MAGGLLQIVSYGSNDLYLTGNPEITYFKVVYRRHTNFSSEELRIPFDDIVGFGETSNLVIPKIGDLAYRMYLEITVPEFSYTRQLDQAVINDLTDEVTLLQHYYELVKGFLSANMTAYRSAYELYTSNNIYNSNEMIDIITPIIAAYESTAESTEFKQMIMDDYNMERDTVLADGGVLYRYDNVSLTINGITTSQLGNICLKSIANYWGTPTPLSNTVNKEITMSIINYLIENCKRIDKKYYDRLASAKAQLEEAYNSNYKFAWVDKLGHSIIDYTEIAIGGTKIDKLYGVWLDIWNELMGKKEQENGYNRMIGNVSKLTTYDRTTKPEYTMVVPLQYWFNRFSGVSLPLIALQYNDVNFRIKFRKFSDCSYIEGDSNNTPVSLDDILENMGKELVANVRIEYIYLDSLERRKFAQSQHEYLIEQTQVFWDDKLKDKNYQIDLDFQQPCIGLLWTIQRNKFMSNPDGHTKCYWNTYTTTLDGTNPVLTSELMFNNYTRIEKQPSMFVNYVQADMHTKRTPAEGINSYWFGMFPSEHQPSGTCNMSRLPKVRLQLTVDPYYYDNNETYTLTVFALNYNIIRILGGMGALAYV